MWSLMRTALTLAVLAAGSMLAADALRDRGAVDSKPSQVSSNERAGAQPPASTSLIPGTLGQRFLVWTLFVLVAPVLTAPVAMRVLAKESNAANVVLLFGYTGLDALAAFVAGGVHVDGVISGALYLTTLLVVFAYNLWMCAFLSKLQKP